jgi:hypothetical protein
VCESPANVVAAIFIAIRIELESVKGGLEEMLGVEVTEIFVKVAPVPVPELTLSYAMPSGSVP